MAGNIIGEPIIPIIGEQVRLRQEVYGAGYNESSVSRSPEVLNYLNNKNAWIKLASGVSLDENLGKERLKDLNKFENINYFTESDIDSLLGKNLAKNYILFNTIQALTEGPQFDTKTVVPLRPVTTQTSPANYKIRKGVRTTNSWNNSQDKSYGGMGGSSRGLQPSPGIIGIDVESVNRGSIRKATVTLKAYNKFQFGIIEILYLKLGFLMMLEWGWDKYIDSIDPSTNKPVIKNTESTIIENQWFKDTSFTQQSMLDLIEGNVTKYKGNYQGFFGKVNNFSWTLNSDNTYDITINLITIGSVIESLQVIVPTTPITKARLEARKQALRKHYLIKEVESGENQETNSVITNLGSDRLSSFIANTIEIFFNPAKLQNNRNYFFLPNEVGLRGDSIDININRDKIPPSSRFYIRFAELLNIIENNVILRVVNGDDNTNSQSKIKFKTSVENTRISYEPNLVPLDPSICIFKPLYSEELGVVDTIFVPEFKKLEEFAVEKDNVYYAKLMNIYLCLDFVSLTLSSNKNDKNELDLFTFLQKLLAGINKCMGNVPELTTSIKNDREIYFLDENPILGYDKVFPPKYKDPVFNILGYNPTEGSSFVTDFNFQTKITPKLMTQISIGATSAGSQTNALDSVGYKNWNKGLTNRFEEKYVNGPLYKEASPAIQARIYSEKEYEEKYKKWAEGANYSRNFEAYIGDYLNRTIKVRGDETKGGGFFFPNSNKEQDLKDSTLKDKVIEELEKIDQDLANKGDVVISSEDQLTDYTTYLLDAFGGKGFNKVVVPIIKKKSQTTIPYSLNGVPITQGSARKEKKELLKRQKVLKTDGTVVAENINSTLVQQETAKSKALYWYSSNNPDFINRALNAFKNYKSRLYQYYYETQGVNNGSTGFIPVTLALTFEGLGGIKIYNKLKVNQKALPISYPAALKFIIDGVNHKVENNKWTTNVTTISQPNTDRVVERKVAVRNEIFTPSSTESKEFTGDENLAVTITSGFSLRAPSENGLMYIPEESNKTQIVLHHTAGLQGAKGEILTNWGTKSSRISTHFIIDRQGNIEKLYDLKYWGYHLGTRNTDLNRTSIGIELVALGPLKETERPSIILDNNAGFSINTNNTEPAPLNFDGGVFNPLIIPPKNTNYKANDYGDTIFSYQKLQQGMPDLAVTQPYKVNNKGEIVSTKTYRRESLFHSYTFKQLDSLKIVLRQIKNDPIGKDIPIGLDYPNQFPGSGQTSDAALRGVPGIYTHNSYRTDKIDAIPQRELLLLLNEFN